MVGCEASGAFPAMVRATDLHCITVTLCLMPSQGGGAWPLWSDTSTLADLLDVMSLFKHKQNQHIPWQHFMGDDLMQCGDTDEWLHVHTTVGFSHEHSSFSVFLSLFSAAMLTFKGPYMFVFFYTLKQITYAFLELQWLIDYQSTIKVITNCFDKSKGQNS